MSPRARRILALGRRALAAPAVRARGTPRVPADLRLTSARHLGRCSSCGTPVMPGDRVLHSRSARGVWCPSCAEAGG